jgi:S-DNA-T family DNA segregation ATPase FtsK/SpoIIIE
MNQRMIGAYQPRSPRRQLADRIEDWKRALVSAMNAAVLRGAGLLLLLGAAAGFIALLTYNPNDPSLDNAVSGDATNWLGGVGAIAADILLRPFGMAAFAAVLPLSVWGGRALLGKGITLAVWRAFAWFAGTILLAVGFGMLPSIFAFPAGMGGLIGEMMANLLAHLHAHWIAIAVPLMALLAGLPLAIFATGMRFRTLWYVAAGTPALFGHIGSFIRMPEFFRAHEEEDEEEEEEEEDDGDEDDDEDEEEEYDEEEGDDDYGLSVRPEPVAAGGRASRVKREEHRKAAAKPKTAGQPALNLGQSEYQLPALGLLAEPVRQHEASALTDEALEENARMLEAVLGDFGVRGRIVAVRPGPVVTLYEFEPAAGVKSSRVISLADDVARSMSAVAARIAVIPGRNVMGIELPNHNRETVFLRELLGAGDYEKARAPLILALGKTIGGEPVMADLAKMPHLLIAGTTGSGKSVALNTMILSLLYRLPPDQARMILIDPKMLELSVYEGIPHLLAPVVTDPRKAVVALKWAVREMEERYRKMSKLGVRGVEAFNERVRKAKDKGEVLKRTVQTGFDRETGKPIYEDEVLELEPMPYIVVVVDEMADLMMISGKEIEGAVQRLAQMARAAGIHLIAATQRPSVDVITGTIKANFPTRISFQVTSKIDSRTILGEQGAEQLLGQGDMLYMMAGGRIRRIHGPFVSDHEVEDVVRFLKTQGTPDYLDAVTEEPDEESDDPYGLLGGGGDSGDELYDKALAIVARERKATTSYIQRRLEIGYNRAARLIERMEDEGVISKPNHQGKREVLLPDRNDD